MTRGEDSYENVDAMMNVDDRIETAASPSVSRLGPILRLRLRFSSKRRRKSEVSRNCEVIPKNPYEHRPLNLVNEPCI